MSDINPAERERLHRRIRIDAADREAALELAVIYRTEKNPAAAVRMLTDAVKELPGDPALLWELEEAKLLRSLQQLGEVRVISQKVGAEHVADDLQRVVANWANTRIQICTARVGRDPGLVHLRLIIGEAHLEIEEHEDAIGAVAPLIDNARHGPAASFITARAHQAVGRDAAAMSAFRATAAAAQPPRGANPGDRRDPSADHPGDPPRPGSLQTDLPTPTGRVAGHPDGPSRNALAHRRPTGVDMNQATVDPEEPRYRNPAVST